MELNAIKSGIEKWNTRDILSKCLGLIDLTSLNSTDTKSKIEAMVEKVNSFSGTYSDYPSVAAICVYPNFASTVKQRLTSPMYLINT